MRFIKKPVTIEAFQLGIDNIPDWFMNKVTANDIILHNNETEITADIKTLEGVMHANFMDYIIKGVKGEIYPCKPDIFINTYTSVNSGKGTTRFNFNAEYIHINSILNIIDNSTVLKLFSRLKRDIKHHIHKLGNQIDDKFCLCVDHPGEISDGYHTFDELYHHRTLLFNVICNQFSNLAWKSLQHHNPEENPMYDDMFIVGINTPEGQATYHCNMEYWDMFNVKELDNAPEWDGHTPEDAIKRIYSLNILIEQRKIGIE